MRSDPAPPREFLDAARELGIEFEPGDLERLGKYLDLLLEANRSVNLTGVRDRGEAWTRHILDSLTLLGPLSELDPGARVIDVGSGGGAPGVPLAITLPLLKFTLLEATGKKARFLEHAAHELGLANVNVVNQRAERAGQDRGVVVSQAGERTRMGAHREAYDAVVARAVGRIAVLAELTVPFAKVGGRVLLIKGQKAEEELEEAKEALYTLHVHHSGTIPTPTGRIVVLEKPRKTPRVYPRREGEPERSPLGVGRGRGTDRKEAGGDGGEAG